MRNIIFAGLWFFIGITATPAFSDPALKTSLKFPPLTGPVIDEPGLLNPQERERLANMLWKFHTTGRVQLVVYIPSSLQESDIETFAHEAFEFWHLGTKGKDQGLLLVVAPQERKMRLEVGYGLEGDITDAFSRRILDDTLAPYFRQQRYGDGLMIAVEKIATKLNLEITAPVTDRMQRARPDEVPGSAILFLFLLFVLVVFLMTRLTNGKKKYWGGGGGYGGYGGRGWDDWGGGGGGGGGFGGFSGGGGSSGGGGASSSW